MLTKKKSELLKTQEKTQSAETKSDHSHIHLSPGNPKENLRRAVEKWFCVCYSGPTVLHVWKFSISYTPDLIKSVINRPRKPSKAAIIFVFIYRKADNHISANLCKLTGRSSDLWEANSIISQQRRPLKPQYVCNQIKSQSVGLLLRPLLQFLSHVPSFSLHLRNSSENVSGWGIWSHLLWWGRVRSNHFYFYRLMWRIAPHNLHCNTLCPLPYHRTLKRT